jgi:transcriptional regulator with PAS, ATPase and Fis domain
VTERKRALRLSPVADRHYPSGAMGITLKDAYYAAGSQSTILLVGESGSGKDFLARWIHDRSRRCNGPFFAINCAAISKELAESELFGHEPGAFTGARGVKRGLLELAEGGTLLLNEIGELSLFMQSKLLTFLDTKSFVRVGGQRTISVNARILAATHRDLESEIAAGRFLEALYYRLNVLTIPVPPLRERIEDLPILLEEIMATLAAELQLTQIPVIDPANVIAMSKYRWPGNVRELRNALERALMLWDGERGLSIMIPSAQPCRDEWHHRVRFPARGGLRTVTEEVKHSLCAEALRRCSGNKTAAARLLGISRDSLYQYIRQFEIATDDEELVPLSSDFRTAYFGSSS